MKNILIMAVLTLSAAFSFGQCTPDTSISTVGIYPGVAEGLDSAIIGEYYEEVLQVLPPADTTVYVEAFGSELNVPINFFRIEDVQGLPTNFEYSCNPPSCLFEAEQVSCISFYGETGWWMAGKSYPLEIEMTAQFQVAIGPISTTADSLLIVEGYTINADGMETSVNDEMTPETMNYSEGLITVNLKSNSVLRVYSLTGQLLVSKELEKGISLIAVEDLSNGIYIAQISQADRAYSYKFIR